MSKNYNLNWNDLYLKSDDELILIASEIRNYLIENITKTGGHIGSSLGLVELTLCLMKNFHQNKTAMLFDTGHNSHVYKILTYGWDIIKSLNTSTSSSVFQEMLENKFDYFSSGHSSTALSFLNGFQITKFKENLIAIVGDAAFENGISFEGLFSISQKEDKVIIILNDNGEGIGKNYLKSPNWKTFFESMKFNYYFCNEGNNIVALNKIIEQIKNTNQKSVLHIKTIKSLGLISKYQNDSNHFISNTTLNENDSQIIVSNLLKEELNDQNTFVINPGMTYASMQQDLISNKNFLDVGINEEHAILLAASLSSQNKKVYLSIYSTFFQREYDFFIHDVIRNKLPITFIIDKVGIQYNTGNSHHGIYDLSIVNLFNEVVIMQPRNKFELEKMFYFAKKNNSINVIRNEKLNLDSFLNIDFEFGQWEKVIFDSNNKILICYGDAVNEFEKIIKAKNIKIDLINARFINPIDIKLLDEIKDKEIIVYEQVIQKNNLATNIEKNINKKIKSICIETFFVGNGHKKDILKKNNLYYDDVLDQLTEG
ncbi:1-deoxy-D-xylulose-5-phosphate synthase N-terminal domain-containing protein [Spiroplasma endosymbiont of Labia minor]|uniref:1-deoxy-D-xylulose-5-phosphate synthase N-terminal domain-containing protein n=1 Tax=Spiroplasma endosymbiont of Labia minor TaxID=3066305 RepID=UPI0030CF9228